MTTHEQSIDVDVPADVAWDQLHRMESYPQFIEGLQNIEQRGQEQAHVQLKADGRGQLGCDTEIIDRRPNEQMAWRITSGGPQLGGTIDLQALDDQHTTIQVRLEYDPQELRDMFGLNGSNAVRTTVRNDLEKFKSLVEQGRS